MATLTKVQIRAIEQVQENLDRALAYLAQNATLVARQKSMATTTLDFTTPDGKAWTPINKEYGSDLAGIDMARTYLKQFLSTHTKEAKIVYAEHE